MTSAPAPSTNSAPAIMLRVAARTDIGLVRARNEDSFVVADLASGTREPNSELSVREQGVLLSVCDGMGGQAAGDVASQLAARILAEQMCGTVSLSQGDDLACALVDAVRAAHLAIRSNVREHPDRRGMGTTCTAAVTLGAELFVAQVGDSRAYLLREGELVQLTKDQSLVNHLVELGQLTAHEAQDSTVRNIILQSVGSSEDISVELTRVPLCKGDRLLLCSDGLSGMLEHDAIAGVLDEVAELGMCADRLVSYAKAAGGRDNVTVVVAQFDGEGLRQPAPAEPVGHEPYRLQGQPARDALLLIRLTRGERVCESEAPAPVVVPPRARYGPRHAVVAMLMLVLAGCIWWRFTHTERVHASRPRPAVAH